VAPPPRLSRPQPRLPGILSPLHLAIVAAILAPAPAPLRYHLRPRDLRWKPAICALLLLQRIDPIPFCEKGERVRGFTTADSSIGRSTTGAGLLNEPPVVLLLPNHRQSHTLWWLGLRDSQVRHVGVAQARSRPPGSSCRPPPYLVVVHPRYTSSVAIVPTPPHTTVPTCVSSYSSLCFLLKSDAEDAHIGTVVYVDCLCRFWSQFGWRNSKRMLFSPISSSAPAFLNFPLLFVVAATDELLHAQGREDRADLVVRAESTELPLVLQVTPTQIQSSLLLCSELSLLMVV
jgi:hypothetical protein